MRTRTGWVVLGAAVLLAVSGCTGEEPQPPPETTAETSETSTPPPSETPAPTPPALPAEATTQDAAGAEAFVRYWFDTLNYGYMSGDTELLSAASSPDCAFCTDSTQLVEDLTSDGSRATGPAVQLLDATSPTPEAAGALVSIAYARAAFQLRHLDGAVEDVAAEAPIAAGAVLAWTPAGWRMFGVGS